MKKYQIRHRYTDALLFDYVLLPDDKRRGYHARRALEVAAAQGASLQGANLSGANLTRADLVGANLSGIELIGAFLLGADLSGANLSNASMIGTNLCGANLSGANLTDADLTGAKLLDVNLTGAHLGDGINLIGERPLLTISPIGLRADAMCVYLTDVGMRIRTGCFFGTREGFVAKMAEEHGGGAHDAECRAALALADAYAEIWTPI